MRRRYSLGIDSRVKDGGSAGSSATHGTMFGAHGLTQGSLDRVTQYYTTLTYRF